MGWALADERERRRSDEAGSMMRRNKEDKFPGKLLKWKKPEGGKALYQVWQTELGC